MRRKVSISISVTTELLKKLDRMFDEEVSEGRVSSYSDFFEMLLRRGIAYSKQLNAEEKENVGAS